MLNLASSTYLGFCIRRRGIQQLFSFLLLLFSLFLLPLCINIPELWGSVWQIITRTKRRKRNSFGKIWLLYCESESSWHYLIKLLKSCNSWKNQKNKKFGPMKPEWGFRIAWNQSKSVSTLLLHLYFWAFGVFWLSLFMRLLLLTQELKLFEKKPTKKFPSGTAPCALQ